MSLTYYVPLQVGPPTIPPSYVISELGAVRNIITFQAVTIPSTSDEYRKLIVQNYSTGPITLTLGLEPPVLIFSLPAGSGYLLTYNGKQNISPFPKLYLLSPTVAPNPIPLKRYIYEVDITLPFINVSSLVIYPITNIAITISQSPTTGILTFNFPPLQGNNTNKFFVYASSNYTIGTDGVVELLMITNLVNIANVTLGGSYTFLQAINTGSTVITDTPGSASNIDTSMQIQVLAEGGSFDLGIYSSNRVIRTTSNAGMAPNPLKLFIIQYDT